MQPRLLNGLRVAWVAALGVALAAGAPGTAARADDGFYTVPEQSPTGDWLTNAGPVAGKVAHSEDQAGALWRVVSASLACRRGPAATAAMARVFRQGTILQANVGRGGSDEVLMNAKDRRGHTWMWVRTAEGKDLNCYVRAHMRFVVPLPAAPGATP